MSKQDFRSTPSTAYNNDECIRIVMVGKTGVGKSATGNTILEKQCFKSECSPKSLTARCEKAYGEVDGLKVAVIDTPGLFDTKNAEEKTTKDIVQSIAYASPGPHIFLIIIKLDRFTEEEKQTVEKIQKIFGEEANKYSMVLFTHGDLLKGKTIEKFLEDSEELQELVAKCNGQYHVFNNELEDRSQVSELLEKIRNINEQNGGSYYTTEMFQKVERVIEEEKQRILKEKEELNHKEQEKLRKEIEGKHQQQWKEELEKLRKELKKKYQQQRKAERERQEKEKRIQKEKEEQNREEQEELEEQDKKYQQQLREMEAEREKMLRDAVDREMKEKIKKLKEEQDMQARREAEESPSVIQWLKANFMAVFQAIVELAEAILQ